MKVVQGALKLLGDASQSKGVATYSVIEIGEHVLKGIHISDGLRNFLSKALNQNGESVLYIHAKHIVGIKVPDGKLYCLDFSFYRLFLMTLIAFVIPFIIFMNDGIGKWFFIWLAVCSPLIYFGPIVEIGKFQIANQLKSQGATPV